MAREAGLFREAMTVSIPPRLTVVALVGERLLVINMNGALSLGTLGVGMFTRLVTMCRFILRRLVVCLVRQLLTVWNTLLIVVKFLSMVCLVAPLLPTSEATSVVSEGLDVNTETVRRTGVVPPVFLLLPVVLLV